MEPELKIHYFVFLIHKFDIYVAFTLEVQSRMNDFTAELSMFY